jgi:hypothetical protein
MSNLLDRGMAALIRRQKQGGGRSVIYTRSGQTPITITAWLGVDDATRVTEDPAASLAWNERDYLIAVADLVIGGSLSVPAKGDTLTETIDGIPVTWGLSTSTSEHAWRYSDQTRQVFRVHCKRA